MLIALAVLLYSSPLAAQSLTPQAEPYGFDGDRLGMSLADFKTAHEPLVPCTPAQASIVSCAYHMQSPVWMQVTGLFVDGKLAGLWIEARTVAADASCFDDRPLRLMRQPGPEGLLFRQVCGPSLDLSQSFVKGLGSSAKTVQSPLFPELSISRWETRTSVAEFQAHMCIKTGPPGAWFSEVLGGHYCGDGDSKPTNLSFMIYLDKQSIRTAITRLSSGAQ